MNWRFWKSAQEPRIDRSKPFDPERFIGKGWKIEEEDGRSLALTDVDFFRVHLVSCGELGRESLTGDERLARLRARKSEHIRLDAKIFQVLWENQWLIPRDFKFSYIFFDGTVLRSPGGLRYALFLWWDNCRFEFLRPRDGRWHWGFEPLFEERGRVYVSATLPPS